MAKAEQTETHLPPIPCTRDEIYGRVDRALRWQGKALVAMTVRSENPTEPATYRIFEVELKTNGQVKEIDVIARAQELDLLDMRVERPVMFWSNGPMPG